MELTVRTSIDPVIPATGSKVSARATKDGSLVTVPNLLAELNAGNVFSASVGAAGTAVSFAKTAYDADQPQLVVDVPSGKLIYPVSVEFVFQDSAGTDTTVAVLASTENVGAGTSTDVTPVNRLFGNSNTSDCTVSSLYTGVGTDPTTGTEAWLAHWVYAFADTTVGPVKADKINLLGQAAIKGTGSLVVYIFGTTTAPAGFLKVTWIETLDTLVS